MGSTQPFDAWRDRISAGLLADLQPDGSFGVHPYRKWIGGHWRLVSLVELGLPAGHRDGLLAADSVLAWVAAPSEARIVNGRERRHASQEGNALFACSRLGLGADKRVRRLVDTLLRAQWPDGGWNCDERPEASSSSFHESVTPIRGLAAYHASTGDSAALAAARRGAELLLEHRLFRRASNGEVIHPEFLRVHWPAYWHYDFFIGLRAVREAGLFDDPRAGEALRHLQALRRSDGTWRATGRRYWKPPRSSTPSGAEAVDWGDASPILTRLARDLVGPSG
jgi:hypothetical protein